MVDSLNETEVVVPKADPEKLKLLGQEISKTYEQYQLDRRPKEEQWLRNLRQWKGQYDPEIERVIPVDGSHAYPKITRNKSINFAARLMEMLFPATEKNWGIGPSPIPSIETGSLQTIIDTLYSEREQSGNPTPITQDDIEKAIDEFAKERAKRMGKQIEDQLDEIEYIQLIKKVVSSAVLYCCGVLKGPMVVKTKKRIWANDPRQPGRLKAQEVDALRPYFESVVVWDWYPDLSAKSFDQMEFQFQRHIVSRAKLRALADRPDFMGDQVRQYLREHQMGNYKERHWETQLRTKGDKSIVSDLTSRQYEWWEGWGYVSGHKLKACGIDIAEVDLDMEIKAWVAGIDNTIIKAELHPYNDKVDLFHAFIYEEDDQSLLGTSLPEVIRDSQLAACEATRALLDNAAAVCGPIVEINHDLLIPGQNTDIHAFKMFHRQDKGQNAGIPAIRSVNIESHISELMSIVKMFMDMADVETSLPPPATGDVSGGSEAYRTSSGASMLLGAAALPIKNTVRNFDQFTTSVIGSLYYWNTEFNPDESIKGDYTVIARGSTSLVAKELRAVGLNQFSNSLLPEERIYISTEKMVKEKAKANDIGEDILEDPDIVKQKQDLQSQGIAAQSEQQTSLIKAQVQEAVTKAFDNLASAMSKQTGANIDTYNALIEGTNNERDRQAESQAQAGGDKARGVAAAV